ncbi:ABC transporter substrate-binding protein [Ruthenibacterium sp. CLA-JM-H11]|uniref:ABC transporter substrate-binding protein n=1 Tax=Ruthenibacterium intestinale TaxID=3133163 RepID=A0ABV1GFS7_9FIRM
MKKFLSVAMALCLAASLVACGGSGDTESAADPAAIKIGGIGPITGSAAQYGEAVKNGIQLAVDEINAKGGIQFAYQFEDDENDIEKGVNAYNSLKDWGMQILVGATTSDPTIAIGEESYNDNIFQLTPSGTAEKCVQYDNAFRVCFSDPNQGTASAKYIGENKLATKVGVIYDSSTSYSSGIYANFKEECENQGIEIVAAEPFTADNKTDMSVQVQKCQAAGAELVFLPIYYTEATQILTTAAAQGYEPLFFGCDGLDGILNVDKFDLSLAEGVMLLTPYVPGSDEITTNFTEKYKETFGIEPNQFAADAYDGVYAIAAACEKAGITADMSASDICDKLKTAFTEISIDGVTSAGITWSASGEPNKEPKAVKIENGVYTAM